MGRPHKLLLAAMLFVIAGTLQTCSKSTTDPVGPTPEPNPTALIVLPSVGEPGSLLKITGFTFSPSDTGIDILVGDQPTVFTVDSSGINALIPLFLDTVSHWPSPPTSAQDVSILKNGKVVASAKAAVTIDSLRHANGATAAIQLDLVTLNNSLRVIYSSLPSVPGSDPRLEGYQSGVMAMLDSLVGGADSSLAAILAGTSAWTAGQAPNTDLIDALLASSGALDFYNEAATSIGLLTDSLASARRQGLFCKSGGPDMDLACQMQIYVVLDDYANYFVKPTTDTYANTVGLTAGLFALSGIAVPYEAVIGALLTVFELVYGTIAPSLFPAELTEFSLTVATDTIGIDELTNTAVLVSATNHPATIRATDVLKMLLSFLGVTQTRSTELIKSATEFLEGAMKWALSMYRDAIIKSNTQSGGAIFIDPTADLPLMTWGPVIVTNPDLVELYSFTEDIITADLASFEWLGVARGDGRIQARGRGAGERSKVLLDNALCWGCSYFGGAFGNNAPGTETKTVVVGKPATLDVQIEGLPSGTEASVFVTGPAGYTSGSMTDSKLLKKLEPGDYHLTAIEVRDATDEPFTPKPTDTTITLAEGDSKQITVKYRRKFGNLLVTVSGLPAGVDAAIDVSGISGAIHVIHDTLIDSLEKGTYSILAKSILDPSTGKTLAPDPKSQSVEIVGGQTATANVKYGGNATMTLFVGNTKNIFPGRGTDWALQSYSRAHYTSDTVFHESISADTVRDIEIRCVDGELQGGETSGSQSTSVASDYSSSQATLTYDGSIDNVARISFNCVGVSAAQPVDSATEARGSAYSVITANGWGVLRIVNPGPDPVYVVMEYKAESTSNISPSCNGVMSFGIRKVFDCSILGTAYPRETPDIIREGCSDAVVPYVITDTLLTVGAGGTQLVELFSMIALGASSWYFPDGSSTQEFTFRGSIDIRLER